MYFLCHGVTVCFFLVFSVLACNFELNDSICMQNRLVDGKRN